MKVNGIRSSFLLFMISILVGTSSVFAQQAQIEGLFDCTLRFNTAQASVGQVTSFAGAPMSLLLVGNIVQCYVNAGGMAQGLGVEGTKTLLNIGYFAQDQEIGRKLEHCEKYLMLALSNPEKYTVRLYVRDADVTFNGGANPNISLSVGVGTRDLGCHLHQIMYDGQ